jgi:hypothetical protein
MFPNISTLPKKKSPRENELIAEFYQFLEEDLIPMLLQLFYEIKEKNNSKLIL